METLYPLIGFLVGAVIGALIAWRLQKDRVDRAEQKLGQVEAELKRSVDELGSLKLDLGKLQERSGQAEALTQQLEDSRQEASSYREKFGRLEEALVASRKQLEEERALLADAQQKLENVFKAASADALKEAQKQFFDVAEKVLEKHTTAVEADLEKRQQAIDGMVKPIKESLEKVDLQVTKLDKEFSAKSAETSKHVEMLMSGLRQQQATTQDLKSILRGPTTRGRAGEMFLKRILEHAGLQEKLHFDLQVSETLEGSRSRPDCIVHLPSGKALVIDAKTPLNAYEDSLNIDDDALRAAKLKEHAGNVRKEIDRLARRPYTDLSVDAELVVMYLPIEASFSAAAMHDPEIVNYGWDRRVILVGPTTLYVLLQTVALDWRQDSLRQNAQQISDLGKEMVDRVRNVATSVTKLGSALENATKAYNATVATIQSRLFVTAQRFQRLGVGSPAGMPQPARIASEIGEFSKGELRVPLDPEAVAALESSNEALGQLDLELADPTASALELPGDPGQPEPDGGEEPRNP